MQVFWNEKFSGDNYYYGLAPNKYLEEKLNLISTGSALFIAEGEGRNAVFAAMKDFDVTATDWSKTAYNKALKLAESNNVKLNYMLGDFGKIKFQEQFDLMVMIFAHFPADLKEKYYSRISTHVKTGGHIIFECFSDKHLPYKEKYPNIGGPNDSKMLFSESDVKRYFRDFEFIDYSYNETNLNEYTGHIGTGHSIKLFAKKIK